MLALINNSVLNLCSNLNLLFYEFCAIENLYNDENEFCSAVQ